MENSKTRFLVPLALCAVLLVGASSAFGATAAATYDVFSTPTFVINVGRSEVIGAVRFRTNNFPLTSAGNADSLATTISVLFLGAGCDNNTSDGVAITARQGFAAAAISSVSNSSAGCVVSVNVPSVLYANQAAGDFIEIGGVRARIDLTAAATAGTSIQARLTATPSGSALFFPSTVDVAVSAVGRAISITTGNQAFCGSLSPAPRVRVTEGFNGAFVQHVLSAALTPVSQFATGNARATAGATNNTQIYIGVSNLPAGVTLTWPLGVDAAGSSTSTFTPIAAGTTGFAASQTDFATYTAALGAYGTAAGRLARLERRSGATDLNQVYEYVTVDQGQSDITTERFFITPTVTLPSTLVIGSAQVSVSLFPALITVSSGGYPDATSITSLTFSATASSSNGTPAIVAPRFNDTTVNGDILAITPCTTNLLFPFVAGGAGFDTGVAIANTSKDPFTGGSTFLPTAPQAGTCTLTGWPAATGTPAVSFTTPTVAAGATFLTTLNDPGNTAFNGFIGYIIARCNFQFGHGFAFIVDNFGVGPPRIAHGYVALVIPDPIVYSGVYGTSSVPVGRAATICAGNISAGVSQCIANLGEGLNQ